MSEVKENYDHSGISTYFNKQNDWSPKLRRTAGLNLSLSSLPNVTVADPLEYGLGLAQGLKEYQRIKFGPRRIPLYIFDRHNLVLFGWAESLKKGKIEKGATLLNFDAHSDLFPPTSPDLQNCDLHDLKAVASTASRLQADQFIVPAFRAGLISQVVWVTPLPELPSEKQAVRGAGVPYQKISINSEDLPKLLSSLTGPKKLIVSVDMDIFAPFIDSRYGDLMKNREARGEKEAEPIQAHDMSIIRQAMNLAGVVTLATSPGFIDQTTAIELVKKLLS